MNTMHHTEPEEHSPEIRATHLDLSEHDWRFRRYALRHPECLRRETYREMDRQGELLANKLQSWPTFVRRSKLQELADLSLRLNRLIRSIPERVHGNDPTALSTTYGFLDPPRLEILLSEPNGIAAALSRADFIDDGESMQCLEFNFSPSLGGWESSIMAGLHQRVPSTVRFMEQEGIALDYVNTMERLFHHVLSETGSHLGELPDPIRIAVIVIYRDVGAGSAEARAYQEAQVYLGSELAPVCRQLGVGGEVVVCHYTDLAVERGRLLHAGQPVHAVVQIAREATSPLVYRCYKSRRVCLFNDPLQAVLTSKLNLALLSELTDSGIFQPAEVETLRRHVPWTRRLVPGEVRYQGEALALPSLLTARRERFVLKDAMGFGGKGVWLGSTTPPERWSSLVQTALQSGGWIVQERVESRPYLYQNGEEGCSPHDVVWGPFVFGDSYAGVTLKMQSKAEEGILNLSRTATEGVIFEV